MITYCIKYFSDKKEGKYNFCAGPFNDINQAYRIRNESWEDFTSDTYGHVEYMVVDFNEEI